MKFHNLISLISVYILVAACNEDSSAPPTSQPLPYDYPGYMVRPFNPDSPFANLKVNPGLAQSFNTSAIPYLEMEGEITVDRILDRTFVSQLWMKERLKSSLELLPPELLQLSRCSKILIVDDYVRGGGFTTINGIVALSKGNLAVTKEERESVTGPGQSYVVDRPHEWGFIWSQDFVGDRERTVQINFLGSILHEWIHACDFKQADENGQRLSDQFPAPHAPMATAFFTDITQRSDFTAEPFKSGYPYEQITAEHMSTTAASFYDYVNAKEHFAMLGATLLMRQYFKQDAYELITTAASASGALGGSTVIWGIKNKGCEQKIQAESRKVLELIDPTLLKTESCSSVLLTPGITLIDAVRATHQSPAEP